MPISGPPAARCWVYTFKEGLLSAVGHDVKLAVQRFEVDASLDADDGFTVAATFDAGSLAVVCATRDGVDQPGVLSDKDRKTIEGYVRDDILRSRQHPKITFRSTEIGRDTDGDDADDLGPALAVEGDLTLHGRTRAIRAIARRKGDLWVSRVRLNQVDFGITPFRAMLGALRIQPHVEIELAIPAASAN